jgi:hypothetical protein
MRVLRSRTLHWLVALPLSGVLLYYSLRGVEWEQVGALLATVRPGWLALGWSLAGFAVLLRSMRWRVLLGAQGEAPLPAVFWATSAGYFGNNFLPARAGELVRTFMISACTPLSRTYVLTTGLAERMADAVALVAISAVVMLSGAFRPAWLGRAAVPFSAIAGGAVLAIAFVPQLEPAAQKLLRRLPFPPRVKEAAGQALAQIGLGLSGFHQPSRFLRFLGFTAVIWFADATGSVMLSRALGLSLSLPAAFLLISALGLSSALPSTPGYVGVYQFVAVTVLVPFGFSRSDAIAFILFGQAAQYVLIATLGGLGFWQYRRLQISRTPAPALAALATPHP